MTVASTTAVTPFWTELTAFINTFSSSEAFVTLSAYKFPLAAAFAMPE